MSDGEGYCEWKLFVMTCEIYCVIEGGTTATKKDTQWMITYRWRHIDYYIDYIHIGIYSEGNDGVMAYVKKLYFMCSSSIRLVLLLCNCFSLPWFSTLLLTIPFFLVLQGLLGLGRCPVFLVNSNICSTRYQKVFLRAQSLFLTFFFHESKSQFYSMQRIYAC